MMEISLTDGYTMCVTCMAAVTEDNYSRHHVDVRWSGVGLLQSLWVNQLEAVTYRNCIAKKLCFSPWLDSHAAEYTCYLTVEADSNFSVIINKSITINGMYVCMHACMYVCMYVLTYVSMYMCVCTYACMCVCTYVCTYVPYIRIAVFCHGYNQSQKRNVAT